VGPSLEIPPPEIPPRAPVLSARQSKRRVSFSEDFKRFFVRGMAALLPTLITLWLIVWLWNFLWDSLGQHIIFGIKLIWDRWSGQGLPFRPTAQIGQALNGDHWWVRLLGVTLAVLLIYFVGVLVGNFIGRTFYRLVERAVMRIPLVRAVYPPVKQVTDFFLMSQQREKQFAVSHVVAVQPHEQGIWSIGLITGGSIKALAEATGEEMVTVFVPSTPTAFSGYVLVVPRGRVVELPLTVEEAMRLLVSGGVISPELERAPT
jgi:uncharacterized membrane protein